jgi:tRNA threonylcarbamoyladenosine biosynthesis protein TsaE
MKKQEIFSNSPAATLALGKRVGESLSAGSILALMGELGCGKTLLTRGICNGLGVPARQVNSPTFMLVNEYRGRRPVFHIDLYRLSGIEDSF